MPACDRPIAILPGEVFKSSKHGFHFCFADRVQTVWIGRGRRKAYSGKSDFPRKVLVDAPNMMNARAQRHAGTDGVSLVPLEEHFDARHNDVITSSSVGKDSHLVVQFAIAVDTDRDADLMLCEEIHDLLGKQRGVCRETKLHALSRFCTFPFGIING